MTRREAQTAKSHAGPLLTIREAAAYVRLSRTTLYGLMNDGQLVSVKIGKARRIPLSALVGLVERNTRTGAPKPNDSGDRQEDAREEDPCGHDAD